MKKTVFILTLIMTVLCCKAVFAKEASWEQSSVNTIRIYGRALDGVSGKTVTVFVYMPGYDESDIAGGNASEVTAYQDQIKTGEDGIYNIEMGINADGIYKALVRVEGEDEIAQCLPKVMTQSGYEAAADEINNAASVEEMAQIIEKYEGYSILAYENNAGIIPNEIAKILYESVQTEPFSKDDVQKNNVFYRKSVILAGLQSGKITSVFDYDTELELGSSDIKDYYRENYVGSAVKANVNSRMKKADLTIANFSDKLTEAFVLSVVKTSDGVGNAVNVLKGLSKNIGINSSIIDNTAVNAVCGKDYADYAALISALNKAADFDGSSSGSSKGSSGGSRFVPSIETHATDNGNGISPISNSIFSDISSVPWAQTAIVYLAEQGIVNGKTETEFYPGDSITRAEFVKILVNALDIKSDGIKANMFSDVNDGNWYYDSVMRAYSAGIVNGYSEDLFGADRFIKREEICVMICRAREYLGYKLSGEPIDNEVFNDFDSISEYARESVAALYSNGIVNGTGNGDFAPGSNATRAEAAKMMYMLIMLK